MEFFKSYCYFFLISSMAWLVSLLVYLYLWLFKSFSNY